MKATVALDGWSTITNDAIICLSFTAGGESYLVNTIDTRGEQHTTAFLGSLLEKQIHQCESGRGVKVARVV